MTGHRNQDLFPDGWVPPLADCGDIHPRAEGGPCRMPEGHAGWHCNLSSESWPKMWTGCGGWSAVLAAAGIAVLVFALFWVIFWLAEQVARAGGIG